jgi:hypothetical protein
VNLLKTDIGVGQAKALVNIIKEHPALNSLCGNKGNETELNMSGKMGGADDAIMLAAEIVNNGALSMLNLAGNNLGELVLPGGWTEGYTADYSAKEYTHTDGRKQDLDPGKPEGIIALAAVIPGIGALSVLSLKGNRLRAGGGKALAEGLKGNQVITELNIASNYLCLNSRTQPDTSGVVALADVIPDMGALIKLDISSNIIGAEQERDLQRICVASGIELAK